MEMMQTIHLRWQGGVYRESIFTVKLADGFRASWPDSAGVCMVHETQRQGETHGQKC